MSRTVVLQLIGEIDIANADLVYAHWQAVSDAQSPDLVVVDLDRVTFIDVAGIRPLHWLAREQRARGGHLVVCNAHPNVLRAIQLTGLTDAVAVLPPPPTRVSPSNAT